jgi:1-acyl-sn-glycerol-3-phosphate acyltransferase
MRTLYRTGWILARLIGSTYLPCTYHNAERVPATGPAILAANHESLIDPPLVGGGLSRALNYLARESLFNLPVMGRILRDVNAVPVDRDGGGAAGLRAILSRLLDGGAILLFPEGTRTPDGKIHPARSGIGLTVIKSQAPVIPVRIFGTYQAWGRHYTLPRPGKVAVKYGRPLDFEPLRSEAKTCSKSRLKDIYRQVSDDIMAAIQGLQPFTDCDRFP